MLHARLPSLASVTAPLVARVLCFGNYMVDRWTALERSVSRCLGEATSTDPSRPLQTCNMMWWRKTGAEKKARACPAAGGKGTEQKTKPGGAALANALRIGTLLGLAALFAGLSATYAMRFIRRGQLDQVGVAKACLAPLSTARVNARLSALKPSERPSLLH